MLSPYGVTPQVPKILLVEDDEAVRRSLQLMLQASGFQVRAFAGSDSLLHDSTNDDAACLVVDYRLSQTDGLALLDALRNRFWRGPAVLITAYPSARLAADAQQHGFAAVLEKPFHERQLVTTVRDLIASDGRHP